MLDTSANPREYGERFAFKITAFEQIERDERLGLLRHYGEIAQAHVRHLQTQGRDLATASTYGHSAAQRARFANVFEHLVGGWTREAAWATAMLASEASAPAKPKPRKPRPARIRA